MRMIGLCLTLLVFLSSCQNSQEKGVSRQILRTNLMTSPPSLDPRIGTDTISENLMQMLFTGLTFIDKDGETRLAVAKSLDLSEDKTIYTFHLKETQWSDGSPLTAHDFVLAWKEILDPKFPSESAHLFYLIKNARFVKTGMDSIENVGFYAKDDYTLVIELENPTPYFLDVLTHHSFYPLHQKMRGKSFEEKQSDLACYISNGPFFLKNYVFQKEILMEKNPHYWDASSVRLEGLLFSIIRDQNTALLLFEQGELDWLGSPISDLSLDAIANLKKKGLLQVMSIAGIKMFMFNTERFPLNNLNIRKALSLAIHRQSLVDNITQLDDAPALGIIPPVQKKERWQPLFQDSDVATAKELFQRGLDELGITLEEFPVLTLSYNTSELWSRVAASVQQQWQEVLGIATRLENADWKVHLDKLAKGDFEIGRYGWDCQFNDAGNILELFKSNRSSDPLVRADLLDAAEKLFLSEMPIAPLFHFNCPLLQQPYLKGVFFSPIAMVDFRWAYLEKN
jgi:oligopeptide transport system substrate-binding protein